MKANMWMVRAGEGGWRIDEFKSRSMVSIGWQEMGDMSALKSRDDFVRQIGRVYLDNTKAQTSTSAGMVFRFVREMKIGDGVVTYDPAERKYLIGTIRSDYRHDSKQPNGPNVRDVDWRGQVYRDALSVSARNSLGAIATLFLLSPDVASEIERVATSGSGLQTSSLRADDTEDVQQVEDIYRDIQNKSAEFIKDRLIRLSWDEMQELVAGLLRAMGYKTRVSPPGADRGKDIVASPDGFGFESPRIVVEVKHRPNSLMGAQEIRSFLGGRHREDKGLYVSSGGFTKEARYEADRATIPLMLMDLDDLVKTVLDYYERMDSDSRRLIPLKRLYWPA
ncbi:MAG: restriction endonuclease [Xanthomonadales bacterium]|nr:restriction endonuclease [Xanthomonadales bacterium]MBP7623408.1 restriction endonuclease [Xanthomonadales bacterium]